MKRSLLSSLIAIGVVTALGTGPAAAAPPEPPEGFEYVPATERALLGIGCVQSGAPTCDSTSYWLGKVAGDSSVGTTFSATPLQYIFTALGEGTPYATFFADDSLAPSYVLRTDEPITGQVTLTGFLGPQVVGVDSTVEVHLRATRVGVPGFSLVDLGSALINKLVVTPDAEGQTYEYEIELPAELDGVEIKNLELDLYVRSLTVLQNGFVDGEGQSWFDLPYYHLVPAQAP